MSQGQKLTERPKVRFSQPSEDSSTISEKPDEPFRPASNKPVIRSIVTLEDPFKVIYKNQNLRPSSAITDVRITDTRTSKSTCDAQSNLKTSIAKPDSPNIQKSLTFATNPRSKTQDDSFDTAARSSKVPTCAQNCETLSSGDNLKSRIKNSQITESCGSSSATKTTAQLKTDAVPKSGRSCASKIGSRHVLPKTVPCAGKKVAKKVTTVSNENVALGKNTTCRNRQKEKVPGRGAMPCLSRNVLTAKTASCGLKISKPGSKTWKTRSKCSPVKKTILRDVNGNPPNVYVGPGVARYYSQPFKMNMEKETPHIRPDIISGEKLSRPEYNSIMCTIDELKKAQAEKFVTDVEHLPLVYRNLVNEKVSAALDFPPDEAIYKNLVDLSVNDNQLPMRLTRSKDPEPRHRDIVPKLSDFFTPTYSEEYCSAVRIRPSSPEIFSNWSAFAISDKIFGWKHDMDQFY